MESEYNQDTRTIIVKGTTRKMVFISEIPYQIKIIKSVENSENYVREGELLLWFGVNVLCVGCDHRINKTAEIAFRLTPMYECRFKKEKTETYNIKMRRLQNEDVASREIILIHNRTVSPKSLAHLARRAIAQYRLDIKNVSKLTDRTGFVIDHQLVFPDLHFMLWQPLQGLLFAVMQQSTCKKIFVEIGHWKPIDTVNSAFFKIRTDVTSDLLRDKTIRRMLEYLFHHPFGPYTSLVWRQKSALDDKCDQIQSKYLTKLPKLSGETTSSSSSLSSDNSESDEDIPDRSANILLDNFDQEHPAITPDWNYWFDHWEGSKPTIDSSVVETQEFCASQRLTPERVAIQKPERQLIDQPENTAGPSQSRTAPDRYTGPNPYRNPYFCHVSDSSSPPAYQSSNESN
jgi:hypothetical protein